LQYSVSFLPHFGGMEHHMNDLSLALKEQGHDVEILTQVLAKDGMIRPFAVHRKKLRAIPFCHVLSQYQVYRQIRHLHQKHAFEVMHVHGIFSSSFLAALATRKLNLPMLVTCHGDHLIPNDRGIVKEHPKARRQTSEGLSACDVLILPNPELEDVLKPLLNPLPRIHVIPHGHHPPLQRKEERKNSGNLHLVAIARNAPVKQIPWMLERLAPLLRKQSHLQLTIIGGGYEGIQRKYADLFPRIQFTGVIPKEQVERYLQDADIFLCPSVFEAFPLAVVEALGSGIPVLGRNTTGIRHLVQHGKNGLLFETDAEGNFEHQIETLLNNKTLREQLGQRAAANTKAISWSQSVTLHLNAYEEAIKISRTRHG
jgi:L-malate glycosyltransferase